MMVFALVAKREENDEPEAYSEAHFAFETTLVVALQDDVVLGLVNQNVRREMK